MFENLLDLVKQHSGDAIVNNPDIPNEHNDQAVAMASNSIFDGLQNAVSNGKIEDVMSLFSGEGQAAGNSAVAQTIQGNFIGDLMNKFGMDKSKAAGIATSLIPIVLAKFVNKTNDPNDNSFDIQSILGKLTQGGAGGFNIQDIISKFAGGGNTTDNKQSGGGIMDTIKGLFGQ